jgi:hypothetical protein
MTLRSRIAASYRQQERERERERESDGPVLPGQMVNELIYLYLCFLPCRLLETL